MRDSLAMRGIERVNLNPAVAAVGIHHLPEAATDCAESGCHPEGDLRSSWNLLKATAERGCVQDRTAGFRVKNPAIREGQSGPLGLTFRACGWNALFTC